MSEADIVSQVDSLLPPNKFVVITGGEPLLQPLEELIDRLMEIHTQVQIETNGTLWQEALAKDRPHAECISVVCSPKLGHPIHERIWWRTDAFKVVYGAGDSESLPVQYDGRLFIQPRDDQNPENNKANLQACIDLCFREGHRLSLQTHKLIGVP
jgi:organic radical activating enzyme